MEIAAQEGTNAGISVEVGPTTPYLVSDSFLAYLKVNLILSVTESESFKMLSSSVCHFHFASPSSLA